MRQWRLIYDYPTRGVHHMAVDEALLNCIEDRPVLRLYSWHSMCLSLGYGQRSGDVDRARLTRSEWDVVRRPSGGRAILHGTDLTYGLILPAGHPIAAGGVIASYQRISRALVAGLKQLGAEICADQHAGRIHSGPVCFETPSHYEITANGRKLVGSAQLRRGSGVLQHGSLPLHGDVSQICDVLVYADEKERQLARQQVRARATTLSAVLGYAAPDWQEVADAIAAGFRECFDIDFFSDTLTFAERAAARQLAEQIYSQDDWTWRR